MAIQDMRMATVMLPGFHLLPVQLLATTTIPGLSKDPGVQPDTSKPYLQVFLCWFQERFSFDEFKYHFSYQMNNDRAAHSLPRQPNQGGRPMRHSSGHPPPVNPDFYFMPSQRKYEGEVVRVYVDYNQPKWNVDL